MLTFLGVLLLGFAIFLAFAQRTNKTNSTLNDELRRENDAREGQGLRRISGKKTVFNFPFVNTKPLYLGIVGIAIICMNGMFFWANAGTVYSVQYPWGGDKMIATQGLKTKMWGRTIPMSYEISIKDIILQGDQELSGNADGIYNRPAHRWEFSDAIKADIATAVVVGVSVDDEEAFLRMADRNRSEGKLINGRVLPNIDAALKNTCKLMDAQEYISGKASDFDRYFRDQLENGMYLVEEYTQEEAVPEIIGDTTTIRRITPNTSGNKQTKYRIKRDSQGNIKRDNNSNTLKQYGIRIYQAQVTGIDWEQSFDQRLDLQKDEVAKTQLEKQEAERQFYTAKKEIAKGEAEKASERAKLEKEQIKLTIAAETKAKVAKQNVIVEKAQLEVEKYKAKSKKVSADAIYYENLKRNQAGLTPQERLEGQIRMNKDKWDNISKWNLPSVYMAGQGGAKNNSGDLLQSLIGADIAKGLMKKNK